MLEAIRKEIENETENIVMPSHKFTQMLFKLCSLYLLGDILQQ